MSFLLGLPIFRGYVKFQGCIFQILLELQDICLGVDVPFYNFFGVA